MEETIEKYENLLKEVEQSRKEILRKAKDDAQHLLDESNARIENTIRTIKEAQAEKEKTRIVRQELNEFKESVKEIEKQKAEAKIARKMEQLLEKQKRKEERKNNPKSDSRQPVKPKVELPLKKGDTVRIKGQTSVGEILDISGKNASVAFGAIKTLVKLDRLERAEAPKISNVVQNSSFVSASTQENVYEKKLQFKQDIDVRGMRGDEALRAVTFFIDDAILLGVARVRILHGTGTGILRTLIREYLNTVPGVRHFQDEHVQFGGAGITVVDLE